MHWLAFLQLLQSRARSIFVWLNLAASFLQHLLHSNRFNCRNIPAMRQPDSMLKIQETPLLADNMHLCYSSCCEWQ
jgi:hypothetical protein